MISSLTSFLFGNGEPSVPTPAELSCSLYTTPADEEWVLVDRSKYLVGTYKVHHTTFSVFLLILSTASHDFTFI
ncbi:hypothetical protein EB796_016604 [Bugula neritina]|uniref:Uncharacterized protein n=1 Tax=Bugula neritina TaxID=10212 RepID=A0A7J7JH14_BUGNE|nr:hypothetical protein EB796_016604 [Bugula neritina]